MSIYILEIPEAREYQTFKLSQLVRPVDIIAYLVMHHDSLDYLEDFWLNFEAAVGTDLLEQNEHLLELVEFTVSMLAESFYDKLTKLNIPHENTQLTLEKVMDNNTIALRVTPYPF